MKPEPPEPTSMDTQSECLRPDVGNRALANQPHAAGPAEVTLEAIETYAFVPLKLLYYM